MKRLLRYKKRWILLGLLMSFLLFSIWQNSHIGITNYTYRSDKVPSDFDGYKIAQISDLHNKSFGENQAKLIEKLKSTAPDLIVITGDLIDSSNFDLLVAMAFIESAKEIAPIYYVSGNHEAWSGMYDEIRERLKEAGVVLLDDAYVTVEIGNASIELLGLSDPDFSATSYGGGKGDTSLQLEEWSNHEGFKILLAHRPERFQSYVSHNMDLVFAGHAHGGQVRIPWIGGLVSPNQGWFPTYTGGRYDKEQTTMYVSRGLGNSIIPLRILNPPEIVVVTLKSGD